MLPTSANRVPSHTSAEINEWIHQQTVKNIMCFASGGRDAIDRRLQELDKEWDIERTLEANAASISLLGLFMGATVSRSWFVLPAVVAGFLLQHAVQGWCPPVPVFRRLGFRTRDEINYERYALKTLRGDFRSVPSPIDQRNEYEVRGLLRAVQS
jgi:hypothetical protein